MSDQSGIPEVISDESGERLARAVTIGAGAPVLAFDVGGTDIKSALFDADGTALGLRRTPTPAGGDDSPARLIDRLAELSDELRAQHPEVVPEAIGLVVPGIVDPERGIGVFSSNLGWRDAPMRDLMAARFGMPVAFDHDVRMASWAEHVLGGARPYPPFASSRIVGPAVLNPVNEVPWVTTNDSAQWGLAAIQNLALVGDALPRS